VADALALLIPWVLAAFLARQSRTHQRHVASLRNQLANGGPPVDLFGARCQCCGRRMRTGRVMAVVEHAGGSDGPVVGVRVWHADKPRCSADYATTPEITAAYLNGGGS
jgi:hypothetical protein